MKKELLSPAGDFESLKAAVHAGCDAVYVGGKKFGARAYAVNFDEENLLESVNYCHLYGVKLYVTVNTMIYEEEMKEVLDYIGYLYKIHVDAVIVQDIGLICEIRKWYPEMEIHASTQLHNHCQENCRILQQLGVKRIVLARELSLSEVEKISTSLEKEVFIHGAICISYSGQCLFSSLVMRRSGNRGACAGMCRLPYSLEGEEGQVLTEGNYLLSPRELSTISSFQELMESDITCFKIEGRMKGAAYVYLVTKIYRSLMDHYEKGEPLEITKEEMEALQVLYNRKFTEGHLFKKRDFDLMNIESSNHIGIPLGEVVKIEHGKLKIHLIRDLHQEDGIRFVENQKGMIVNFLYDSKGKLIQKANALDFVWIDNKVLLKKNSLVLKTSDKLLIEKLLNYPLKKIPIKMKLIAKIGKELFLEVSDGIHIVSFQKGFVVEAVQKETSYDEVYTHLNRLGNTIYCLEDCDISIEKGVFIPMRMLNELRRACIERLNQARIFHKSVESFNKYEVKSGKKVKKDVKICCLVRTEEQLKMALEKNVYRIYVTDLSLYEKYHLNYPQVFYRRKRIYLEHKRIDRTLVSELSQLEFSTSIVATDYYLNVANSSYLSYLKEKGVDSVCLSVELDVPRICSLAKNNVFNLSLEVIVYGRLELMIMKHCPLHMLLSHKNQKCNACEKKYHVVDRNRAQYPLVMNSGITHLFSSQKDWFTTSELQILLFSGIDLIRIEFFDESFLEVGNILEKYQQILQI